MRVGFFTDAFLDSPQAKSVFEGVKNSGDEPFYTDDIEAECDIAFHSSGPKGKRGGRLTPARERLIQRFGKRRLVLESAAFRFGYQEETNPYWRLSLGGFLYDEADYANKDSPPDRWQMITKEQGIRLEPFEWKKGKFIIVCLQKPSDASLRGQDTKLWGDRVYGDCRQLFPDEGIVMRYHPLDMRGRFNLPLREDLARASAVITYTSLSAIESICAGVPTVACNSGSLAWPVAFNSLPELKANWLLMPSFAEEDRLQWLCDLAYTQWKPSEIEEGIPWKRLRATLSI